MPVARVSGPGRGVGVMAMPRIMAIVFKMMPAGVPPRRPMAMIIGSLVPVTRGMLKTAATMVTGRSLTVIVPAAMLPG